MSPDLIQGSTPVRVKKTQKTETWSANAFQKRPFTSEIAPTIPQPARPPQQAFEAW
jgi:hypothetical protein